MGMVLRPLRTSCLRLSNMWVLVYELLLAARRPLPMPYS